MGKLHLWRKHSYARVRVEKDNPGCVWTVFRVLSYNRWHNVKKMLPYKKHKSDDKNSQSKVNPDDHYQLEGYDALIFDSASVNSSSSRGLSTLTAEDQDKSEKIDSGDEEKHESHKLDEDEAELSTPTLVSLLKADPKLDSPRIRGLSRSGTFPSPKNLHNLGFGTTPSKVESKHTEIWPVMNHGYELRKSKSLRIRRSSSLNEISSDKFGNFFDGSSKNKEIKKFPSLSEKEFTSLGDLDHHNHLLLLRKCLSARVSSLEDESFYFGMKGLRIDSDPKHTEKSKVTRLDEDWVSFVDENYQEQVQVQVEQIIDDITSEHPLPVEDLAPTPQIAENTHENEMEDYNEELEYVKHVLDVLGFVGGEITGECLEEALDPQLFDEIEVLCPFKPTDLASSSMSRLDRKLLFHLIIEALVDIQEKLFAYYAPNSSAFRAMPTGKSRIVEDVWEFASKYLNRRPEFDPRLDLAMGRDLTKSSRNWKNPQTEIEYVGLDLEDLIFEDLLDEILCC